MPDDVAAEAHMAALVVRLARAYCASVHGEYDVPDGSGGTRLAQGAPDLTWVVDAEARATAILDAARNGPPSARPSSAQRYARARVVKNIYALKRIATHGPNGSDDAELVRMALCCLIGDVTAAGSDELYINAGN